jgi:mannose-6-phosphate isomerase class I
VKRLVDCDKFVLDRWRIDGMQSFGGDGRFHILSVLDGELFVGSAQEVGDRGNTTSDEVSLFSLIRGQTLLVPASVTDVTVAPRERCVFLDMYLP